jgi:hypothetical protein
LPERLSSCSATATLERLAGGDVLFRAGTGDDGCYCVEDVVIVVSGTVAERIIAFLD